MIAICGVTVLAACDRKEGSVSENEKDNVVHVDTDDPRMVAARQEAIRRRPEFVSAFQSRKRDRQYAVKAPFKSASGEVEYLWVAARRLTKDEIVGLLANDPILDVGIKSGDQTTVKVADVHDWIVSDEDGTIHQGGFQFAVLRKIQEEKPK
jgi:uncharacterized protein YegJ (DUF2314 family)